MSAAPDAAVPLGRRWRIARIALLVVVAILFIPVTIVLLAARLGEAR